MKPLSSKKFPEKIFDLERLHMNIRIKEIATRAQIEHCVSHVRLQEFAELILQDCMSICESLGNQGLDGHYCVDEIRRKFGV